MKIKQGAAVLVVSLALTALALTALGGCGLTGSGDADPGSDGIPLAGTSTSRDAAAAVEKVSAELRGLTGVEGKPSEGLAGVTECPGRDPARYFQVFHPWSFHPASDDRLDEAMERLKAALPAHGWKVARYGPDTSQNKNLSLTADNGEKKYGVSVVQMKKNDPPKLSLTVVSGCYEVPEGKEVERF
ncbi:hypothetical protein ACFY04_31480 [Streptomyces sp. NPDC001549]|uniref:hypothetical protein n=1 Tax=Streptomyces sp. NPDC001549 TaxID=3364586 RepID=UPI00369C4EF1